MNIDRDSATDAVRNANAQVNAGIMDAVSRGVPLGISGDSVGQIIPPPPSFDKFHGRVCLGPGLQKNGFGNPKVCGRQAVAVLRTFAAGVPEKLSVDEQAAKLNAKVAMQAYAGTNNKIYAGGGPSVGHMILDPAGPLGDDEHYVCYFHGQAAHRNHLHPDDNNGIVPDVNPAPEKPVIGLGFLDPVRQWRTVCSDPNLCSVTDGITTVLVKTREYISYLQDHGSLPPNGQPL
jgi:hypothetical protein